MHNVLITANVVPAIKIRYNKICMIVFTTLGGVREKRIGAYTVRGLQPVGACKC